MEWMILTCVGEVGVSLSNATWSTHQRLYCQQLQTPRRHAVPALGEPFSTGKLTDKMNHPFGVYRYYLFCGQFFNKISFIQISTFTFIKLGTIFLSLFSSLGNNISSYSCYVCVGGIPHT